MRTNTPEKEELLKTILDTDYVSIEVQGIRIEDDTYGGCTVKLDLDYEKAIEGYGVGMVDAAFRAFALEQFAEYDSLRSVKLHDFKVVATSVPKTADKELKINEGFDTVGEATVVIRNTYGNLFVFTSNGRSIAATTIRAVAKGIEFFVNSEKAFVKLYQAYKDAMRRDRQDLVERYKAQMSVVVECTSYGHRIDRIEKEISNETRRS